MQVGILTYHRSHNYGALLQAIALRKVISDMGYDVRFVDYWPEYHRKMYSLKSWVRFKNVKGSKKFKPLLRAALTLPVKFLRIKRFRKFISKNIESFCSPTTDTWDIVVCGSDQIWRKQLGLGNKFNPEYFGSGEIKSKSYISYAASMGVIDIEDSELPELVSWLNKFKYLSVREEQLRDLLLTGGLNKISTVLDPTLLLSKDEWSSIIVSEKQHKREEKYLLVYDLLDGSFDRAAIKKFAKQRGLEVIILRGEPSKESYKYNTVSVADPFDMVRLIQGAEMVFTSSYHGLVFSILYERNFVASFNYNSGRAYSLLRQIGLSGRLIPARATDFPLEIINFTPVIKRLMDMRNNSLEWLREALISTYSNIQSLSIDG